MKKRIITVMTVLLAMWLLSGCGAKKVTDVAIPTTQAAPVEVKEEVKDVEPKATKMVNTNVSEVPGFKNPDFGKNFKEYNNLLVEPRDYMLDRLYSMTSGDVYFTIVLDDNSHYICTSVDELAKLMTMMEYFGRSGDMIYLENVEEYLSDYQFDKYLHGQYNTRFKEILDGVRMEAYTEGPWDNKYKNWVNGK